MYQNAHEHTTNTANAKQTHYKHFSNALHIHINMHVELYTESGECIVNELQEGNLL